MSTEGLRERLQAKANELGALGVDEEVAQALLTEVADAVRKLFVYRHQIAVTKIADWIERGDS